MPLPPMPPPTRRRARLATVQRVTEPPTSGIVANRSRMQAETETLNEHHDKQARAQRFADLPPLYYPVTRLAMAITQVEPEVQHLDDNGDWAKAENADDWADELLGEYANRSLGMNLRANAGLQAYHYSVTGEYVIVQARNGEHVDFRVYPLSACSFDRPRKGEVTVKDVAGGRVRDGTAYIVPKSQTWRCWNPHPRWPGQATSHALSAVDALEGWHATADQMRKQADSRFALGGQGKVIAADSSWNTLPALGEERPLTKMLREIAEIGQDATDLRSLMPPLIYGPMADGKVPVVLDVASPYDEKLLAGLNAWLEIVAQTLNMAGLTVKAGGPGTASHWNEWENSDDNWRSAAAPLADRVFGDITTVLWKGTPERPDGTEARPGFGIMVVPEEELGKYRIGYDPTPAIQRPDRTDAGQKLGTDGHLRNRAVLEAAGFDPDADTLIEDDWTKEQERNWLITVKSAGKVTEPGAPAPPSELPVGPSNVQKVAPERPTEPPSLPPGPAVGAVVGPKPNAKVVKRLEKLRAEAFLRLREKATTVLEDAVDQAAMRAAARAGNAKPGTRLAAVAEQIQNEAWRPFSRKLGLGPFLAALGLTEQELLRRRMERAEDEFEDLLVGSVNQQRAALERAGYDPDWAGTEDDGRKAAGFLLAGVTALAFTALREGPPSKPDRGEVTGRLPAGLVRDTLDVAAGVAAPDIGAPGEAPSTHDTEAPDVPGRVAEQLGMDTTFTWVHGMYGEPERPFDPHVELDGETFATLDDLPPASEDWLSSDRYQPGDHDGCTCGFTTDMTMPEAEA